MDIEGLLRDFAAAGVEGDSVPCLEFLAPDRGVMLVARGVVSLSVLLPGDLDRTGNTGDEGEDPARRGVRLGLPFRKVEDKVGVRGLEVFSRCLSDESGMVDSGDRCGRERSEVV